MLEYSIIQTRGFTSVAEDGRVTGFRLLVRMPNYRGAWGSLIDGADVTVDGRAFARESTRWTLRGRTFTLDELRRSTDLHWDLAELATITVPLDGGPAPGCARRRRGDLTALAVYAGVRAPAEVRRSP